MNRLDAAPKLNPFKDDVVGQPRAVEYSVPGLNDAPLNTLLVEFERLTSGQLPRTPIVAGKAQLIISPDAGYGKSHLVGRLFQRLAGRATLIYLRPFQNAERGWSSILQSTVQELVRPDKADPRSATQLEAFATGVLAHVAADSLASRGLDHQESVKKAISHLRDHPLEIFAKGRTNKVLLDWLKAQLAEPNSIVKLARLLNDRGVILQGKEQAWLRVLAGYAFVGDDSIERDAALTWLRGEQLEPDQVESLKLATRENDGCGDAAATEINDLSRSRLQCLCMLASYYRPFVFCFDQTEFYGSDATLVNGFGSTIEQLFAEFPNQITVVTSNASNWTDDLLPKMHLPYHARFSPPIDLEGINRKQAQDLISQRLSEVEAQRDRIAGFLELKWFDEIFRTQGNVGVRRLLKEAAKHFPLVARSDPGPDPYPPRPLTIEEAFEAETNDIRAKPSLHQYSQDCLMWVVETMAQNMDEVSVSRIGRRYFSVRWKWPDRSINFAFEAGHHNARWRAIAREAIGLAAESKAPLACVIFRTPDLKPIPAKSWNAARQIVDQAQEQGLRISKLTIDEVCELHAAREFYSNAVQRNVDFGPDEVLAFLRERFTIWFRQISNLASAVTDKVSVTVSPRPAGPPQSNGRQSSLTPAQVDLVLNHMKERRLVDVKEVLDRLGGVGLREALLREVENHPNLKAHGGPQTTILQWRV
jgi:hypothetical protein